MKTIDDVIKKIETRFKIKPNKKKLRDFWQWYIFEHRQYYNMNNGQDLKSVGFNVPKMNELANKGMLLLYLTGENAFKCSNGRWKKIGRHKDGKLKSKKARVEDLPYLSQKSIGLHYSRVSEDVVEYECQPKDKNLFKTQDYLKRHGGWARNIDEIASYPLVIEYFGKRILFKEDVDSRFVGKQ